jgi:hypothetical protein
MVVNCEHVWRELSNYIENEVDSPVRAAMDEHFATCKHCVSLREGMVNVVALYGDERMLEVPAGFSRRLEEKLAQHARPASGWSTWSAWLVPLAALLVLTGGVRLASSLTFPTPLKSPMAQAGRGIPPEMTVLVTADTKVFHVAGCPFMHHNEALRTLTAKEAIAEGYVPCLRCMRKYLDVAAVQTLDDDDDDAGAVEQDVIKTDERLRKGAGGY